MCLIILLGMMVYMIVTVFFQSAQMLLPWTITATILSVLVVCLVSEALRPEFKPQLPVYGFASFVVTMLFGFLGFWLSPPVIPPPEPPKRGLEQLAKVLIEPPKLNLKRDDLLAMLPIHLAISGCIGAFVVERNVKRRYSRIEAQDPGQQ